MSILTLDDAKAHARVTIADDDALIQSYIDAAEAYLASFIGQDLSTFSPYPAPLLLVTKMLVAHLYDNREIQNVASGLAEILTAPGFDELVGPYRCFVF